MTVKYGIQLLKNNDINLIFEIDEQETSNIIHDVNHELYYNKGIRRFYLDYFKEINEGNRTLLMYTVDSISDHLNVTVESLQKIFSDYFSFQELATFEYDETLNSFNIGVRTVLVAYISPFQNQNYQHEFVFNLEDVYKKEGYDDFMPERIMGIVGENKLVDDICSVIAICELKDIGEDEECSEHHSFSSEVINQFISELNDNHLNLHFKLDESFQSEMTGRFGV